jgi:hypothetical protein
MFFYAASVEAVIEVLGYAPVATVVFEREVDDSRPHATGGRIGKKARAPALVTDGMILSSRSNADHKHPHVGKALRSRLCALMLVARPKGCTGTYRRRARRQPLAAIDAKRPGSAPRYCKLYWAAANTPPISPLRRLKHRITQRHIHPQLLQHRPPAAVRPRHPGRVVDPVLHPVPRAEYAAGVVTVRAIALGFAAHVQQVPGDARAGFMDLEPAVGA